MGASPDASSVVRASSRPVASRCSALKSSKKSSPVLRLTERSRWGRAGRAAREADVSALRWLSLRRDDAAAACLDES